MVQYCVLYLFCCNVRPVSPRIRSSVLTAYLRQNADGACLIITRTRRRALFVSDSLSRQYPSLLTRTPARAHSQAEKHHFALSPPRGQGSGRQIYAAEKRPHTVEYGYGGINRAGDRFMPERAPRGLFVFCFLTVRRLLCARATGGAAPTKRYPAARHKRINTGRDADARLCRLAHNAEH